MGRHHAGTPRQALLLAAGLGTRLRPLTLARAKPAIPLAGEPMIRRIVRWLVSHDVTEIVVNLHHLPETIAAVTGDGTDVGAHVRYSWEQPRILGSAGGPRQALPLLGADTFWIVNGDTLTDLDLVAMADEHRRSDAMVTVALVPNRWPTRYGGIRVEDGRVVGFVPRGSREPSHHFIGVQLAQARAFEDVADGAAASSIGGIYDEWIRTAPGSIRAFSCEAAFWDIGTPADYWAASASWAAMGPAVPLAASRRPRISGSARVTASILWDDVEVGADASLTECIVTDGVSVPAGSAYRRAMLVRALHHGRADGLIVSPLDID